VHFGNQADDQTATTESTSSTNQPDLIDYINNHLGVDFDTYFSHLGWPKLEYCSLDFEHIKRDTDYFQPVSIGNHPSPENDFTHIVEYKHLLHQTSINTIYFIE
jgi:UDP-galactopyranose mutase